MYFIIDIDLLNRSGQVIHLSLEAYKFIKIEVES